MLSVGRLSSAHAGYYLGLAAEDYYAKGGEPQGTWFGQGADSLGLTGNVEPSALYNLFRGYSPDGDSALVQLQRHEGRADHHPGWDFTFSAPKSVSTLWSQVDQTSRALLQAAHDRAVRSVLSYLERTAIQTRRGKGGHQFEGSGLVAACFAHSTSRAQDPQLHEHILIMNVGVRADGSTGTLSGLHLFAPNLKMTLGALYRAGFAYHLEQLGIEVRRVGPLFEVAHVSRDLVDHFSKRRQEIEAEMARKGLGSAKAAAAVAIETRQTKETIIREKLFGEWQQVGRLHGWSETEAKRLFGRFIDQRNPEAEMAEALQEASASLTKDRAHFSSFDFIRALAEEAPGRGFDAESVIASAERHLALSSDIVRLGSSKGVERFTTKEMFALEHELLQVTEAVKSSGPERVRAETVMRVLARHSELSEEQMRAVWHLTTETDGLALVSGYAGSGKTWMLKVAREIWEAEGLTVIGTALAGRAQRELSEESGIPSKTLAKIFSDLGQGLQPIPYGCVLVMDEAGMVATPEWLKITSACAQAGAKLCAVGHEKQLQPIGPGAPFAELGNRYGTAVLANNQRQREQWAKKATRQIADGKAKAALAEYAARGLVSVHETRSDATTALIHQWREDGMNIHDSLILAGTKKDVTELNRLAQAEMAKAGRLTGAPVSLGDLDFYVGDSVMFTKTSRPRQVDNGARGVVTATDLRSRTVTVASKSGGSVTVSLTDFPYVNLGYAMTTHKSQGASTGNGYVLVHESMQDKELSYVQASRARDKTRFFVTPSESGDAVAELAKQMERSRQKEMAISIVADNRTQRNVEQPSLER